MQILPTGKTQFIDSSGAPLSSGSVGFYFPGTLNPKTTSQDAAGLIANPNPVPLDSRGQAIIWGSGVYRQIVKDASGVTIWDQITQDANAGLIGNITDAKFVAGVDFTAGVTTTLTLPAVPGTVANMWVFFDAAYQADDQILSLNGAMLVFNAPIPVGVQEVNIKIGSTVAVGAPGAGTVTDVTVANGAAIDSAKLSFLQAGAGALRRTVQSKLREAVSITDFGAIGDSSGTTGNGTDNAIAIQAAITFSAVSGRAIYIPSVASGLCYRVGSPLTSTGPVNMIGDGCEPMIGSAGSPINTRGPGSWLYFDHQGKGISVNDTGTGLVSATFEKIGTIRNQPAPNGGVYTPLANDFDFWLFNCEVTMRDFVTLNPTNGVKITASSASSQSRAKIDGWRGQPLTIGLDVAFSADVTRTSNVHFWPFWSFDTGVQNYMLGTAVSYKSGRNDNPMLNNFFSFGYAYGMQIYSTPDGSTHKIQAMNVDFDFVGKAGLYLLPGVNGVFGSFCNFTTQGYSSTLSGNGIIFDDASFGNEIFMTNVDMGVFGGSAIYIGGTSNNKLVLSHTRLNNYNGGNGGSPAINVRPTSSLSYDPVTCEFLTPLNGATPFNGSGTINAGPAVWAVTGLTTDAGGLVTISNTLGHAFTGGLANIQNSSGAFTIQFVSSSTTSTIFKVFNASTGAPLASTAIAFAYSLFF